MKGEYSVTAWCARHDEGRKFYELIHIKRRDAPGEVVIRRWGKDAVRQVRSGGETMIKDTETFADFSSLRSAKVKRGYVEHVSGPVESLTDSALTPLGTIASGEGLERRLGAGFHWATVERVRAIMEGDGSTIEVSIEGVEEEAVAAKPAPTAPPKKSVVRDESWGSW